MNPGGTPTLARLAGDLVSGRLTPGDLIDRLEENFARREPEVHAFVEEEGRFERLRREVAELVAKFPTLQERPPLFGVPVAVKDVFHVDGFATRGGSQVPPEELAGPESAAVTRLKAAGALVLGKAVTTEFAFFGPGPTRNPHDPERTPGGSSSGSAAAVGAGLAPLSLGTQTIGSISRPASFCGAVGFKPSYERISRAGVIPLAPSLDHIGCFTPDVAGARLAASVLCEDWRAASAGARPVLGIPEGPYLERASEEGLRHFEQVAESLTQAGFDVRRVEAFENMGQIESRHWTITAAEAARVHKSWFERFGDFYHPKTRELIERGRAVGAEELERALVGREELRHDLAEGMRRNGIDLWISPAAPGPAPRGLDSTGDPIMNLPWTHSGLPTLAIPSGRVEGMPMGLQVAAGWRRDERLLAWGEELEAAISAGT